MAAEKKGRNQNTGGGKAPSKRTPKTNSSVYVKEALAKAQEAQRQAEFLALLEASRAIHHCREFKDAAGRVFTACKNLIGATAGYIALLSKDGTENEVAFLDPGGLPCTVDPSLPMPIRGLRAEAYKSGKAVYDNNFPGSEWTKFLPPGHVTLENALFAPLNIEGKMVGLLGLANKPGGFTEHDVELASAFGEFAAIALNHSRVMELLEASESRFRTLFEQSPYGIFINDLDALTPIEFNDKAASQLGYTRDEFAKLRITDFEASETAEDVLARNQRLLSKGTDYFETRHRTKSGEIRDVEVILKLIKLGGKPVAVSIFNDVTSRKLAQQKLRFQADILSQVNDAVIAVDKEQRIMYWNKGAEHLYDLKANEVLGKILTEVYRCLWLSPGDEKAVNECLAARGFWQGENIHIKKNGEAIHVEASVSVLEDEAGSPAGLLATIRDITERKKAEAVIREKESQIECLVQSNIIGIMVANMEGKVIEANDAFLSISGYTREDLLAGKIDWRQTTPPEFCHLDDKGLEELFAKGSCTPYEKEYFRKDGSRVPILTGAALWSSDPDNPTWVCFILDLTERKKAEEQLIAYERLATIGRLAGNISHELRNPLAIIDSSVFYLRNKLKDATDEKIKAHLERMHDSVVRSTGIIQSLLDLTRMKPLKLVKLDLRAIASETIAFSKIPSTVKIVQDFAGEEVAISGDREQLRMAFGNIVKNAVEAINGEGTLTVSIHKGAGEQAAISLTDTGPGIPPENLGKLFQPLFSTKARGIGFGLAITKMIVERHNGTIEAKSAVGKGATFTIKLPKYTSAEQS